MLKVPEIIFIPGNAGRLQTQYIAPRTAEKGIAVINHPNPRHGGTFSNKVVQIAAKALSAAGFHCYLPNLRGVGESDGEHSFGTHEPDDVVAVAAYARAAHPQAEYFVLAGFSFGGYVSLFAAQMLKPDALILLGAAVRFYDRAEPSAYCPATTLMIHGSQDEVVPMDNALAWAQPQDIPVGVVAGAGHFFHGRLPAVRAWIDLTLPELLRRSREGFCGQE